MTKFKNEMLGVVSEGTLRLVDLSNALVNTYKKLHEHQFIEFRDVDYLHVTDLEFFRRMILKDAVDLNERFIMEEFEFHMEYVENVINEVCAEHNCWYGSHPDDPACIGIWENIEE